MSGGHFVEMCRHGVVANQCRCPGPNKDVRIVACPERCTAATPTEDPAASADHSASELQRLRREQHETDVRYAEVCATLRREIEELQAKLKEHEDA